MNLKWMRQQESSVTKFLALSSLLAVLLAAGGCGADEAAALQPETMLPDKPRVEVSTRWIPNPDAPTMINRDARLRLHMTEEEAFEIFPRPRGAFDFFEESPITGEDFVAKGWQTNVESLGLLLLRNKVVLALYTLENPDNDTITEKIRAYEEALRPLEATVVPAEIGSYWFWESGSARLMIVTTADAKKRNQLVIALGDVAVMNALRMSSPAAREDLIQARVKLNELQSSGQR